MSSSKQLRSWWSAYRCAPQKMVKVGFPGDGRTWDLLVAAEAVPLWERFAQLMTDHDYLFLESAGGTYKCRKIAGTSNYSLHSYGTACDLNPSKNPYKRPLTHNYPQSFIDAVLAEKSNGKQAFRWGGSWSRPDAMHWEINVAPSDITEGEDMATPAEIAAAVWAHPNPTHDITVGKALDRNYRNINELILAHRAGTLGTTAMADIDDDDLSAIADAVADEQAERLSSE